MEMRSGWGTESKEKPYLCGELGEDLKMPLQIRGEDTLYGHITESFEFRSLKILQEVELWFREEQTPSCCRMMVFQDGPV